MINRLNRAVQGSRAGIASVLRGTGAGGAVESLKDSEAISVFPLETSVKVNPCTKEKISTILPSEN